jgi:hypothetical protein
VNKHSQWHERTKIHLEVEADTVVFDVAADTGYTGVGVGGSVGSGDDCSQKDDEVMLVGMVAVAAAVVVFGDKAPDHVERAAVVVQQQQQQKQQQLRW